MIQTNNVIYKQIENYLLDYIKTRKLQPGDRLPPEREIGKLFNASHVPVRQATDVLVKEGILERVHGKGTYVKRLDRGAIKTDTIGILYWPNDVAFYQSSHYATIMGGIKLQAEREEQKLVYRSMWNDYLAGQVQAGINDLVNEVDGFLVMEMIPDMRKQMIKKLQTTEKPVVVIADNQVPNTIDTVVFDHEQNTRDVARFLIAQGHQRIGFVYQESKFYNMGAECSYKIKAYQKTLQAHDIDVDETLVMAFSDKEPDQLRLFGQLMNRKDRPTALICHDDGNAYKIYSLAQKSGIRIPDDLSVIGYDDIVRQELSFPKLTTMRLPFMELGLVGMRRVLEKIQEAKQGLSTTLRISLPGRMVERDSHKNIKSQIPKDKSQ